MARKRKPKRIVKSYLNRILALLLKPIFFLFLKIPEAWVRIIAEIIAWGFYTFAFPQRRYAMENLRLAFKDNLSPGEMRGIAKESMKNIVRMMAELTVILRPGFSAENTPIKGENYLKEVFKSENGVLILGSHVGNFLLLILTLTKKGYPLHYVFKESKDKNFNRLIYKLNRDLKLNPIPIKPRDEATKRSLNVLREKEILWLALDQDTKFGDIGIEFFGVKVGTSRGPAILAQRTGAIVIPMYTKRSGWLKHTIIIKKPIELINTGNKDADIYTNLKRMNEVLEEEIKENPHEWWWVHRRWKRAHKYQE